MIRVTVQKQNGRTTSLQCAGHAMFDQEGRDIVCAAVSILVLNTLNSIEQLSDSNFSTDSVIMNEDEGLVIANFSKALDAKGELLIQSLCLGLSQIEQSYGKRYLEFQIQEVTSC